MDTFRAERRVEEMRRMSENLINRTNMNIESRRTSAQFKEAERCPPPNIKTQTRFEPVTPAQAKEYNHRNRAEHFAQPEYRHDQMHQHHYENEHKNNNSNPIGGLLDGFLGDGKKVDQDKIIIIMLIILLARQGADIKLLLALGYIIM